MNLIVCVDDNYGMLFNNRRLSSDIVLCERIVRLANNSRLLMNSYSAKLFEKISYDLPGNLIVDEHFLEKADRNDYCFAENVDIRGIIKNVNKVYVYKWNRKYPSDLKFPIDCFLNDRHKLSSTDFVGNSHPVITEEVYDL